MNPESYVPRSWTTFRMFAQIFVAFGEGAGQLTVSDDAVNAAVHDYAERLERAGDWGDTAPAVLGIARLMGQIAADRALSERRAIITASDYSAARTVVHSMTGESRTLEGSCPWLD